MQKKKRKGRRLKVGTQLASLPLGKKKGTSRGCLVMANGVLVVIQAAAKSIKINVPTTSGLDWSFPGGSEVRLQTAVKMTPDQAVGCAAESMHRCSKDIFLWDHVVKRAMLMKI